MNRKLFLATTGAVVAASGAARAADVPGGTDLIERRADFDEGRFAAVASRASDVRQLWDNAALRPGVLTNIKNALNSLQFGFGYDPARINVVAVNHGPSTLYTYNDYLWEKYKLGDFFDVRDVGGTRIARNAFLASKSAPDAPDAERLQDTGIVTLQARGVTFMTCHTAVAEQSLALIKAGLGRDSSPAAVMADILTNLIPGALVIPGGAATIAVLQQKYAFSYATVQ
jgi:intracellular sulfur oxidation DsrE/DsrF family protein